MKTNIINRAFIGVILIPLMFVTCKIQAPYQKDENTNLPDSFTESTDTINSSQIKWDEYFNDPLLISLIDTALINNQELNIILMEIEIAQNEIRIRKGEYLPFIGVNAGVGVEKVGRYTSQGANDANTEIAPGREFPEPLGDLLLAANVSWEIDIWKKLRNAKKAAFTRFLGTVEGKNFMVTNLISEIAETYYELLAYDNQLVILNQNIQLQTDAFEIMKLQKQSAKITQLPVNRFEALILNSKSMIPIIQQKIVETENKINFLVGRFPQPVERNSLSFIDFNPTVVNVGVPSQLLANRPDIKEAEFELAANKLDVQVARVQFYPSLGISSNIGLQAFNPAYWIKAPESILFSLLGDITAPLINRNAIKANFNTASAKQVQAVYEYEQTILNAIVEVSNQVAKIDNLGKSFDLKKQEVDVLTQSTAIANNLFKSARADYMEVLMTQKETLESRFDLIETKMEQLNAWVKVYQTLGGGWK
jgi:NodT family efflux transporter outer membrane factor (OMF) lipoprotein